MFIDLQAFHPFHSEINYSFFGETQASKGQGMSPWLQQMFMGEEDCVMNPKNVCERGYQNGHPT